LVGSFDPYKNPTPISPIMRLVAG